MLTQWDQVMHQCTWSSLVQVMPNRQQTTTRNQGWPSSMMPYGASRGSFSLTWNNFNPAWISRHIHYKVWDEITYSFPNFNGGTVEVWEWISNFIPHFIGHLITYSCCESMSLFRLQWVKVCYNQNLPAYRKMEARFHTMKLRQRGIPLVL